MALFDEKTTGQLRDILKGLKDKVTVVFFTQEFECGTCRDTRQFLEEVTALSDNLILTVCDFVRDKERADLYRVDKIPAIVLLDSRDRYTGVRFFGVPGGYEINSFLKALLEVSGVREAVPETLKARIGGIKKEIHIQVFISLACPYCPAAVSTAHRLALESDLVTADMVESSTFAPLAIRHNVSSVPKIVINGTQELIGAQPMEAFLDAIEKL